MAPTKTGFGQQSHCDLLQRSHMFSFGLKVTDEEKDYVVKGIWNKDTALDEGIKPVLPAEYYLKCVI